MAKQIQAIRGMNDCLPEQSPVWQKVDQILRQVVASYGYSEVRMPIVEQTHLFKRAIGEVTDVVEKEMYTFEDRNGDSLSLRPEGTASCVRAGIEHGLLYNQERRMWYMGPMFRHERPQKGRYRQFHQFGVELFGINGPDIDAELIMLTHRLWRLFSAYEPQAEGEDKALDRKTHQTIAAVAQDIEALGFNKAVARIYELTGAVETVSCAGGW